MAYSTINKPSLNFNTVLYTGNGNTSNAITGVGFQPDLVWLKNRSSTAGHHLADAVRGKSGTNYLSLSTDTTADEAAQSDSDGVNTIGTDGFTVGYTNSTAWNNNTNNYVSWNWKAANSSGSSNTDGTITSTVSANTTAGFSIVKYTGTGSNATFGHGLSSTPDLVMIKNRDGGNSDNWFTHWTGLLGSDVKVLYGAASDGQADNATAFNSTKPTSSVVHVGTNSGTNASGDNYIAYCWHSVKGYSKIGKYLGNASTDGTFVNLGFKPRLVIIKKYTGAENWEMKDTKIDTYNVMDARINMNSNAAEGGGTNGDRIDFLSNGFKCRDSAGQHNDSNSYVYYAVAEETLVGTNGIPATAR